MQQQEKNVFTPSAFVMSCDRGLGFVVSTHPRFHINSYVGNRFLEKRLEKDQATHYIFISMLPMFSPKKRNTSLSQKPKRQNSWLWKVRQFCKFWQPIVLFATGLLTFLLNLILMVWREFQS